MRPSNKSRSRNKNANRNRSVGNVTNRVFDSSGPEGRVRGTPQQIIEKYQTLARDAQLSGDRVATENFLQHSEHYSRMLGEAQREIAERQEQQQKNRERSEQQGQNNGQGNRNNAPQVADEQPDVNAKPAPQPAQSAPQPTENQPQPEAVDVLGRDDDNNSLVETPENGAAKAPKPRTRRRAPAKDTSAAKPEPNTNPDAADQPPVG